MTPYKEPNETEKEVIRIKIDAKKILLALAILLVIIGGVALRLDPLADSQYPYLTDGIKEARYSEHISMTGTLTPESGTSYAETHTINTPAYNAFLALSSQIIGTDPLFLIQELVAPFTILTLLGSYVFTFRISNSRLVGLVSLMGIAAYGPFIVATQASWKETLGFALIPLIFLTIYYREDTRMRILSFILVLLIPFVHHYVALIIILTVAFTAASGALIAKKEKRLGISNLLDSLIAFVAIDEALVFYSLVKFDRLEFLTPDNGLYLFIGLAIFSAIGIYYVGSRCLTSGGTKALKIVTIIGMLVLVTVNLLAPIGLIDASYLWAINPPLIACLILMILGLLGIAIWASSMSDSKTLYFAILAAPFTLLAYALIRGDDLISTQIISRSYDFADLGVLIGLGSFLIILIKKKNRVLSTGLIAGVCVLLILTVPMSIDTERYLAGRNSIYEFEFDGINWADEVLGAHQIETDEHFMNVRFYTGGLEDQSLPLRIEMKQPLKQNSLMIGSERWVTIGFKDVEYGWMSLNGTELHERLNETNLLYVAGPSDICIYAFIVP